MMGLINPPQPAGRHSAGAKRCGLLTCLSLAAALMAALAPALAGGEPAPPEPAENPLWVGLPPAPGVLYLDSPPGAEAGEDGAGFNPNAPAAEPEDDRGNQAVDKENPYYGLRRQVLDIKQPPFTLTNNHSVVAAIVDMDMDEAVASLACVADGTVSLYFSTGGGQLGLGSADEGIRTAALAFLNGSAQFLDQMEMVQDYPLPQNNKHFVYIVAKDGVYRRELDMETIDTASKEMRLLNDLYQNVLDKILSATGRR